VHIVDEIAEDDHGGVASESDAALLDSAEGGVHGSKDVFDTCSDSAFRSVGSILFGSERPASPAPFDGPVLDVHAGEGFVDGSTVIGAVTIQSAVVDTHQIIQDLGIMDMGGGRYAGLDEFGLLVDLEMILVAEEGFPVLLRLPHIDIFLPEFCRILRPRFRNRSGCDLLILGAGVALDGNFYDRRINDLPAFQAHAMRRDLREKCGETLLHRIMNDQRLLERPDRILIRKRTAHMDPQESLPAQTIFHRQLGRLFAQTMNPLQHQNLEQKHLIIRRTPAFVRTMRRQSAPHMRTKRLPIDKIVQPIQRRRAQRKTLNMRLVIE
jgi:hypothetical protein